MALSTFLPCSASLFTGSKFAVNGPDFTPNRINFRQFRVSAAASCASRTISSHIAPQASLYEVLGIQMSASCHEIKAAYRKLARILHPDITAHGGGGDGEFIRVHEAYATLTDPKKRADYDQMLICKQRRSFAPSYAISGANSAVASGFSGYSRRTWETDQCW